MPATATILSSSRMLRVRAGVWPLVGLQSERLNRAWLDFGPMPAVEPCHIVLSGGDEDGSSAQTKHRYHGSRASGADPDLFGLCRNGHRLGLCHSGIPPEVSTRRCFVAMGAVMKGGKYWDDPETAAPFPQHRTRLLKRHARQCRFIMSEEVRDAICCGSPTADGSSWCAWHRRLVYVPQKPERGRPLMGLSRRASIDPLSRP